MIEPSMINPIIHQRSPLILGMGRGELSLIALKVADAFPGKIDFVLSTVEKPLLLYTFESK